MKIKFASDIIKLTFEEKEPFAGRSVIMNGEALYSGFDAALSTMVWLPTRESVTVGDKQNICNIIKNHNTSNSFVIMFMEE